MKPRCQVSHLMALTAIAMVITPSSFAAESLVKPDQTPSISWVRQPHNPLLIPPKHPAPRSTYEAAIADPYVLYDHQDQLWKAWYSTSLWDTAKPGQEGRVVIKYAESRDAIHWTPQDEPALVSRVIPGAWDDSQVETPTVIINPDTKARADHRFIMFYSGGNREGDRLVNRPLRGITPYYAIGMAWSADGRTFSKHQQKNPQQHGLALTAAQVFQHLPGFFDGAVADPDAVVLNGRIYLYFTSYAENAARSPLAFGISCVTSTDGINWNISPTNPINSLFKPNELGGAEQPAVIFDKRLNRFEMWYRNDSVDERLRIPTDWFTTYGFWHAVSSDGITWNPDYRTHSLVRDTTAQSEIYGLLTGCTVVRHDGIDHIFYCAWGTTRIPDPALYRVPLRDGRTVPATIGFHLATRQAPITPIKSR